MKNNTPLVSVVVPSYNAIAYISGFMKSLLATAYPRIEIIIVDDGSTDGTLEFLQNLSLKDKRVKIIKTLRRLGLTRSRNLALQCANGQYIAFSETDMEFDKNWLTESVKELEMDKTLGAVTGKVFDINKRKIIQAKGIKIIPHVGWVISIGVGKIDKTDNQKYECSMGAVGSVVRRSVIEEMKGFDEAMDRVDDIDLGWRIWIAGHRIVAIPSSITYHVTLKSWKIRGSSVTKIQQEIALARSLQMIIKNYEILNVLKFFPVAICIMTARAFLNLIHGNPNAFLGLFYILFATILNSKKLLKERKIVQGTRKFSDKRLFHSIMTSISLPALYVQYQNLIQKKLPKIAE